MTEQPILKQLCRSARKLARLYPLLSGPIRTRPNLSERRRRQLLFRLELVMESLHGVSAAIDLLHRTPEDVLDADLAALVDTERERAERVVGEGWAARLLSRTGE